MIKKPPGVLLRSLSSIFKDKVFYVYYGKRYWIRDGEWLKRNGFSWPDDIMEVAPSILYSFSNGGVAPIFTRSDLNSGIASSSMDIREIAASQVSGTGLEFGAGASPFPVPLECNVLFADIFSYDALKENIYPGQDFYNLIRPDYVTDIKNLAEIASESLDFIIACHVIEHTNNPIAALDSCYRALKPGGSLVLVVPDMTKTFDREREPTTLDHLIQDYISPSVERDLNHYKEFYAKAFPIKDEAERVDRSRRAQESGGDIHYHSWTYESFFELMAWHADKNKWHIEFSHPTIQGDENIEFYFTLLK